MSGALIGIGRRFGRFSLVGWMGAILQPLLVSTLTKRGVAAVPATLIAVEITILHNFVWHQRFTWRGGLGSENRSLASRLTRFHAGNGLISLSGNSAIMYCLADLLKAPPVVASIAGIGLCAVANFLVADRWVFRDRPT